MRVVEHCLPYSSPEMQAQINALREAFSVDTSKPFELKPTLGLRSPAMESHPTPPSTNSGPTSGPLFNTPGWTNGQDPGVSRTMTPSSEFGHGFDGVAPNANQPDLTYGANTYDMTMPPRSNFPVQNLSLVTSTPTNYALDVNGPHDRASPVWDPSGIFNSWNTAFGGAAAPQGRAIPIRQPRRP